MQHMERIQISADRLGAFHVQNARNRARCHRTTDVGNRRAGPERPVAGPRHPVEKPRLMHGRPDGGRIADQVGKGRS